jgi:hypothetical protein
LAIAGLLTFVTGVFYARHDLSLKLRHGLLAFGCIINAALLSISLAFVPFPSVLLVACTWPGWIYVLWKFGWRHKVAVAIPLFLGVMALLPVLGGILFALAISGGAHP